MERPKRRYKDNPYFLIYDEKENKYYVLFKDGQGVINNVEVSFTIYDVFNCFELQAPKEMGEYNNHHVFNINVVIYEPILDKAVFDDCVVIKDFNSFASISDVIIANRLDDALNSVYDKVYTRDLFTKD